MTQWVKGRDPCHQALRLEFKRRHIHGRGRKVTHICTVPCASTVTQNKTSYMTGRGSGSVLACMCNTVGLILNTAENNKVKIKKTTQSFLWLRKESCDGAQIPPNFSLSYLTEPGSRSANFLEMCYFSNVCISDTSQAVYQLLCWLHHSGP